MPGAFLLPKYTWPDGQIYRKEHLHVQLIPKENIQRAREMDLLTYLTYCEPGNLKHVSWNDFSTVEHDSLIINNGKWCWSSRQIGGKYIVSVVIYVVNLT